MQALRDHFTHCEKAVQALHDHFTHCEKAVQALHDHFIHYEKAMQALHDHFIHYEKAVQALHGHFIHYEKAVQALHSYFTHCEKAMQALRDHFIHYEKAVQALHDHFTHCEKGVQALHDHFIHYEKAPASIPKNVLAIAVLLQIHFSGEKRTYSNIELTLNKGFDIEKNGFPYKFPRVYETFIPLIMICFTACAQRQEWPHKNWRCPCSLKGHTQTPLIIRKLFPIDYKKGRLPSHNNAPASEL